MALIEVGSFGDLSLAPAKAAAASPPEKALESFSILRKAEQQEPDVAEQVEFGVSPDSRGLALTRLRLDPGFQNVIQRVFNLNSNVYFLAWCWDLSGKAVQGKSSVYFYPGSVSGDGANLIPIRGDEEREFLGAGALLYPQRPVTAGMALRIQIWESKGGQRQFGKKLTKIASTIQGSDLNTALTAAAAATGVPGLTLAAVEQASLVLAKVIGTILEESSDDYLDYYEGYFPSSDPWTLGPQTYDGPSSTIVLNRI